MTNSASPIARGHTLTHPIAERLADQKIIPRAFDWEPQGSRLLVVVDKVPEKIGQILLTEAQRDMEQMGTGWIIGVGPLAGLTQATALGNVQVDDPLELLGRHVMFGFHTGKAIRFSVFDNDYDSQCLLLAPLDIWMIDFNKDPVGSDEEYQQAYANTEQGKEDAAAEALADARRELIESREG